MSKLRVGVIGLGIGRSHISRYKHDDRVELAALCDMNEGLLNAQADEHHVQGRFTDAAAMFADANLDAVSIAVPNCFHAPLTMQALEAGLHVLCEKPMAMTVDEAVAMQAAADEAGKNLMINLSYRFSEMSYALKQQVDAGVVGDIYFGRTVWHRRRGMPKFGGWFGKKDMAGGGPLIDLGVHRIDLALWLMGHPEPVSVSGSTYNVIAAERAKRENVEFTVEDLAAGIVKFANGATLIVEASWALNINENEHMVTSLFGDKGGLVQKNKNGTYEFEAEIYTEEGGNLFTKKLDRAVVPAPAAMNEFVSSILENRPPSASGHDGIRVQKILEGLYRSAGEGKEIRFD